MKAIPKPREGCGYVSIESMRSRDVLSRFICKRPLVHGGISLAGKDHRIQWLAGGMWLPGRQVVCQVISVLRLSQYIVACRSAEEVKPRQRRVGPLECRLVTITKDSTKHLITSEVPHPVGLRDPEDGGDEVPFPLAI